MSHAKILMIAGDFVEDAWPAHPAWLAKFLVVLDRHLAKQTSKKQEAVV